MEQFIAGSTDRGTIGVPATALIMESTTDRMEQIDQPYSQILSFGRSANYILEV
jgi:hypothetical protein